jgi:type II secretory pathway pseudopilin PulG
MRFHWHDPKRRVGLTLVELITVLAIIGALIALLFPAVQRVREVANRTMCANNLRQLALATLNYEQINKSLPPGSKGPMNADGTFPGLWADPQNGSHYPWGHFGWPALLLPYLEEENLFRTINFDQPSYAVSIPEGFTLDRGPAGGGDNRFAATHMPKVFVCPSAIRVKPADQFKDYGINCGTGRHAPEQTQQDMDGIAFVNSHVRLQEISDGVSNTLLFLEFAHFSTHGSVPEGVGTNQFIWVDHDSQGYVACAEEDGTPSPPNSTTWGHRGSHSPHPGGVQAIMVDGHMTWLPNAIDYRVYMALFTRAGNEFVPPDF